MGLEEEWKGQKKNINTETINKILINQIQKSIKRTIHHNQLGFIPVIRSSLMI